DPINRALNGGLQRRDRRKGLVEQRTAAGDIKVGAAPSFEAVSSDLEGLGLDVGVPVSDVELVLRATQLEIIAGHLGGDAHQHVEAVGLRSSELGTGSLHRSPDAPEKIELPG